MTVQTAAQIVEPADRAAWSAGDYERLTGAMVEVDTPADAVDRSWGLVSLSDAGVVVAVFPVPDRGWRLVLDDGFVASVEADSRLRICRNEQHAHAAGRCPVLHS